VLVYIYIELKFVNAFNFSEKLYQTWLHLWNLKLSLLRIWRWQPSGLWRRVVL